VRFTVRDDHVIESSAGIYIENRVQWADKFRTMTGLREDFYYGSDESTLQANSGKIVQAITSPKGNLIFGPGIRPNTISVSARAFTAMTHAAL
jgi:hypothetical protein